MCTPKSCNFDWNETANGQWEINCSGWRFHFQGVIYTRTIYSWLGSCRLGLCWSYEISHWKLFQVLNDWDGFFLKDKHDWNSKGIAFPFYKSTVLGMFGKYSKLTSMLLNFTIKLNSWSVKLVQLWLWLMKKHKFPYSRFDTPLLSAFLSIGGPSYLLDVINYKN